MGNSSLYEENRLYLGLLKIFFLGALDGHCKCLIKSFYKLFLLDWSLTIIY